MTAAADFALVLLASAAIVVWLKERSLYVLFLVTYLQNFVVAYLYTSGWAGRDFCRSLLLLKELMLLGLFGYSLAFLHRRYRGRWPRPLTILFVFACYCVLRFSVGALFLNEASWDGLRKVRMMIYPAEILTVAVAISWCYPEFTRRFARHVTYGLAGLAAVAIVMFLFARVDFWKQYADIASYNVDVKGDDPSSVIEDQGIPGTGAGREAFLFLSSFRAMGTFADPLTLGFATIAPILLLQLCFPANWWNHALVAVSGAALFFTFSRSCWIFLALAFLYVWYRRGNYRLIAGLALAAAIALIAWPPLAEFAASDFSSLSWNNPGGDHAEGIAFFYQKAFSDAGNLLGKGMDDSVQKIPENGYAFLLEHFGLAAYVAFIWFCLSLFAHFRSGPLRDRPVYLIVQAIPLSILAIMHFSQYPFAFSEFLFIWFLTGMCLRPRAKTREYCGEPRQLPA